MSQSGPTFAPADEGESPDSSSATKPVAAESASAARHRPGPRHSAEAAADEHTLGAVRIPYVWVIVALVGLASVGLLIYTARKFQFYYDEWDWLDRADQWTLSDYFVPHNEHWSTVPMLVYKVLLSTVGMRSYLPYLAAMVVTHALGGMVLFAVLRKRGGDVLALALTVLFLFLGTGSEDLNWAFQIGFDASLLFGLLGVALLHGPEVGRWRRIGGCVALLLGLASSGIGLFYLVAAGLDALLQRDRWRRIWPVVVGLAVYLVWFEKFGKAGMSGDSPLSLHTLSGLIEFVPVGVATSVAGVFGTGVAWGSLVLPLFIGAAVWLYVRFRPTDSLLWASVGGLVAQFVLTGMTRVQFGTHEATQNRYVTMAAPFVMIIIAVVCARLPQPDLAVPAVAIVALVALVGNLQALSAADHQRLLSFEIQDQELAVVYLFRNAPGTDQNAIPDLATAPTLTVADYLRTRKDFGGDVPVLTPASLGNVYYAYVNAAVHTIMPMRAKLAAGLPKNVDQCTTTGPSGGSRKMSVAGGRTVYITSTASSQERVTVQYWLEGPQAGYPGLQYWVPADGTIEATLPQTGLGLAWHLNLSTIGTARICQG